jgi:hypothetical protein
MPVSHPDKHFIDTNVVLYLYSEDEPDKKAAAEAVVRGAERAWISTGLGLFDVCPHTFAGSTGVFACGQTSNKPKQLRI